MNEGKSMRMGWSFFGDQSSTTHSLPLNKLVIEFVSLQKEMFNLKKELEKRQKDAGVINTIGVL